jgi:hypothetical protein
MSQAVHHVEDIDACGRELRRIAVPGARVLLRGLFVPGGNWVLGPYFPAAVALVEQQFPSLPCTLEAFSHAGLSFHGHQRVPQAVARDGNDLLAPTRVRADSALN